MGRPDIEVVGKKGWELDHSEQYLLRKLFLIDPETRSNVPAGSWAWGYAHVQTEDWNFKTVANLEPEIVGKRLWFCSYHLTEIDIVTSVVQAYHRHEGDEGWEHLNLPEDFPTKDIKDKKPIMKDDIIFVTNNSVYWAQKHKNHMTISRREREIYEREHAKHVAQAKKEKEEREKKRIFEKHSKGDLFGTDNS